MIELEFVRGDSIRFTVTCTRPDANDVQQPIDLTDAHLWCTLKLWPGPGEPDAEALVQVEDPLVGDQGINILNQVTNKGQAQVLIAAGVTQGVGENAEYRFDVQVLEADDRLSTPVVGTITFVPDVTFAVAP